MKLLLLRLICFAGTLVFALPILANEVATNSKISKTVVENDQSVVVVEKGSESRKRIALVIGNGNYRFTDSLSKLSNPGHDAEDIAVALRSFGFEVMEKNDQTKEQMDEAITEFGRRISGSEAALFYFA